MTHLEGLLYGAMQGLTEFLPVSSSAHLVLLPWALGWRDPGLGFDVALHLGTLLAVLWYFWRDWWELAAAAAASLGEGSLAASEKAALFWKIVVASIPAGIVGMLFEHQAEEAFRAPLLIAGTLASLGVLLYWADRQPDLRDEVHAIPWRGALWIGLAQAAAIVPGVSRSGITITAARLLGAGRETSARFSFLLSTPVIAGAALIKLNALLAVAQDPAQLLAILASAVAGFAAIGGLIRYVRLRSYLPFVLYRFALAAGVVALVLTGAA
ncbi:MAG: undecaprenyl-diphosphate phosphatase [Deltaproteobacteria bacterium]|nr:undecaprenyl-diphosphate phosphatase [Deltaproteobacteria bacterium]